MVSKAAILPLILTATSLAFFTLIHLFVFLSIQGFLAQRSLFSRCFHSNGGDGVGELEKETQRKKKSKNLGAITVFKLEKKKKVEQSPGKESNGGCWKEDITAVTPSGKSSLSPQNRISILLHASLTTRFLLCST